MTVGRKVRRGPRYSPAVARFDSLLGVIGVLLPPKPSNLALSEQDYAASFFGNSARPDVILTNDPG